MARKKGGKSKGFVSQGQRRNTSAWSRKQARRDFLANTLARTTEQVKAWTKGKRVMLTIPNPIKSETNKPFVRVPATQVWGKPGGKFRMKESN
tara:strand:+ start:659 stop:937 length:279 start_codon:yes stop_codon:yes gene_type:complete